MTVDVSDRTAVRPTSAGFGLELPAGSTSWPVLLDRVDQLSARELEVFLRLGSGASNRAIAGRLGVTERTVKAHVAQVMAKLLVESRLQAGLVSLMFQLTFDDALPGVSTNCGHPAQGCRNRY
ncbi:helix-turn-helix domain-containing protein [Crossiella cryophila]|uniref:DNA-binding NarL/FixJ family response regulator n=1 Tax=Crossiella cryophila TaxID=43355 RepID=A0A7W7CI47_9PSEU|nr:helix-turn-helix transcriptional regulator [Crossiella cryophila]MBB4681407.1 DNA-binding NarL/FixJ family response regulator [Crossiella cryophila]